MKKNFNFYKKLFVNAFKTTPWLLLLFCGILFSCPDVFAATYNVSSKVQAVPNFGGGTYGGYAKGIALPTYYNVNTRYNGQLAIIDFYLDSDDWDWNYNKTYTITLNMATEDWRNNFMGPQVYSAQTNGTTTGSNLYVSNTFRFISYKQIKFNFKLGSTLGPYIKFRLYSTNTNTTNITGVNNWNLSSITISDVSSTPVPTPVPPTPTPSSGASNQDIINNNNANTQSIIDSNNSNTESIIENNTQNTTDIINNNNANTQSIIDSNKENFQTCYSNLWGNGNIQGDRNTIANLTQELYPGTYTISYTITNSNNSNTLFQLRDSSGNLYQVSLAPGNGYKTFTISGTASKYRLYQGTAYADTYTTSMSNIMLVKGSTPQEYDDYGVEHCSNKIDETTNAINQQNEYLMDDSNPNISDNDFLNTFNSIGINDPLSYLLTLPTQLINKIVSLSDTCSTINLGTLYGVMISLPCINLENYLGSSVWNIIDVIFSVSLLVIIFKNLYDTFSNLLTMGAEKEAKEKFSMPTPMDFLSMILGGDR